MNSTTAHCLAHNGTTRRPSESTYPVLRQTNSNETKMKSKIALIALLILIALTGCAPHRHQPRIQVPTASQRLHLMNHKLNLTMAQVEAIKPILDEEFRRKTEIMALMEDGDEDEKRQAVYALEDLEWDTFKKLSEHLTPEQVHLLSELLLEEAKMTEEPMQEEPSSRGERRGPRP